MTRGRARTSHPARPCTRGTYGRDAADPWFRDAAAVTADAWLIDNDLWCYGFEVNWVDSANSGPSRRYVTKLDKQRSLALATRIGARRRDCFRNAFRGMQRSYTYVVGWAFVGVINRWFEHAWLETRAGRILDPTAAATAISASQRRLFTRDLTILDAVRRSDTFPYTRYRAVRRYTIRQITAAAQSPRAWRKATTLKGTSPPLR
jgi:hypothetical protein